ncbi:MAG TPA: VOC family protein [Vicinamibacteria bacterium]|nr:VOC family protein [Vicinamibacteria bacterium]
MSQSVAGRVMPMIVVSSVDAIRNYYVDTLGFTHVMGMVGKDGQLDFCTVVMGEARIMFMRGPGDAPARAEKKPVEIYLEVEDVEALHGGLRKKGVAISDPLTVQWWGDRTFKVLDPNGYEIWFYTNVAEPTPPKGAKLV